MNEIAKAVDHASVQSDRWLFIASIALLLVGFVLVVRYLVKQNETLVNDHKEGRDSHQATLTKIVNDQNETQKSLAVILDRNTCALDENTAEIARCRELRERRREHE